MQNWVSKKVLKNAEPGLQKGPQKRRTGPSKRLAKSTALGPQKGSATNHAGADQTMYFSGPFLCTFYLTNTDLYPSCLR